MTNTAAREQDIEVILVPGTSNAQRKVNTDGENPIKIKASINEPPENISKQKVLGAAKDLKIV